MDIERRRVLRWGLCAGGALAGGSRRSSAQVFQRQDAEKVLFPAEGLPGGGQLEIRMRVDPYNPDPDIVEVARRAKPFDPESYYAEWRRVAEKSEALAEKFEAEGRLVTAHDFYLRAASSSTTR